MVYVCFFVVVWIGVVGVGGVVLFCLWCIGWCFCGIFEVGFGEDGVWEVGIVDWCVVEMSWG